MTQVGADEPTRLRLRWDGPTSTNGSAVSRFDIAKRLNNNDQDADFATLPEPIVASGAILPPLPGEPPGVLSTYRVVLDSLDVGTVHEFRLRAWNEAGASKWSRCSKAIMTFKASPPTRMDPPATSKVVPTGCEIRWTPPARTRGSDVLGYRVYFHRTPIISSGAVLTKRERRAVEEANRRFPPNEWICCGNFDKDARTITFKTLDSSNIYHFRVAAENASGVGEQSKSSAAVRPPTRMEFILQKRRERSGKRV